MIFKVEIPWGGREGKERKGSRGLGGLGTWPKAMGFWLRLLGSSSLVLTWATGCLRKKQGWDRIPHYLEIGWPGIDNFALYRSEKVGLGVPSNRFRGGQGSAARGRVPSQATGIVPTHSGANNAGQLSPAPHQKGLILFQPPSKLLKARGFIPRAT